MKKKEAEERAGSEPLVASVGSMTASVKTGTAKGITDGDTHTVLLWGEGDTLTPCVVSGPLRELTIMVGNKPYDHCATAPDGTWIYRNDRKN